jgi:hypothetical protein
LGNSDLTQHARGHLLGREEVACQEESIFSLREILPAREGLAGRSYRKQARRAHKPAAPLAKKPFDLARAKSLANHLAKKWQFDAFPTFEPELNEPEVMFLNAGWWQQEQLPLQH